MRLWAGVDFVVTGLFALPPVAPHLVSFLYQLNGSLGEVAAAPPFHAVHWFFVCLAGTLGVLWAFARFVWPLRQLGLTDAAARLWVAGLIVYFVTVAGAPRIFPAFVLTEVAGSLHQFVALRARTQVDLRR